MNSTISKLACYPLSASNLANWSSDVPTTMELQQYINEQIFAGNKIIIDIPVCIDGPIFLVDKKYINLSCKGDGKIIVANSFTNQVAVWVSGVPYPTNGDTTIYWDVNLRKNGVSLLNDASLGDISISISYHSLKPGDLIRIASTEPFVTSRTQYLKGEFAQVQSISGNSIRLSGLLKDFYLASDTKIFKMTMPKVNITDVNIERNSTSNYQRGLVVWECSDVNIKSPHIQGFNDRCLELNYCLNGIVTNQHTGFADRAYTKENRTSYSCVVGSSENVHFIGGQATGGRHSFSTGGYNPNRNITVDRMLIANDNYFGNNVAALDSHENIDGFTVTNCEIRGGMDIAGQNIQLSNNKITTSERIKAVVVRVAKSSDYVRINNNQINGLKDSIGGIILRSMTDGVILKHYQVFGNTVHIETAFNRSGIGIEPTNSGTNFKVDKIDVHNNHVVVTSTGVGATCYSTLDVNILTNIPMISVMNWSNNTGHINYGRAVQFEAIGEYLYLSNSNIQSSGGNISTFKVKGFKSVKMSNVDIVSDTSLLNTARYNSIEAANVVRVNGGTAVNSNKNGLKFINIKNNNWIVDGLERYNCIVDNLDFQSDNAMNRISFHSLIDSLGNILFGYNISNVIHDGNGKYVITLANRMVSEKFPINVTPSPSDIKSSYQTITVSYDSPTKFNIIG